MSYEATLEPIRLVLRRCWPRVSRVWREPPKTAFLDLASIRPASTRPSGRRMISSGMSMAAGSRGPQIPADRSAYGSFFALRDKSESNLRAIIEEAAAETELPAGSEARKIGDLYASFMDEARADELGKKPIEADLARVDAIADKAALIRTLAALQREGVTGLFGAMVTNDAKQSDRYILYLNQGGISLPDESYYRDAKFKPIREAFVAHVAKIFELAGVPEPEAAAARVMAVETGLAKHHWDRVKSRDRTLTYNKLDRKQLDALDARLRLGGLAQGIWSPADRRGRRPPARLLHGDGEIARPGAARRLEDLAQVAGLARGRALLEQAVRRRGLRLLRQDPDRNTGDPPALEARRGSRRESDGRSGRQDLRRQALPARGQGADEGAGRQPDRGLPRRHRVARLDEPRNPQAGPREARQVQPQDRLSRQVARLLGAGNPPR